MKPVTLELEFRGERRRVLVDLGAAADLLGRASRKRPLVMRTESGVTSRQLVGPGVAWDSVLSHAELLLAFEADGRYIPDREAA